MLNFLLFSLFFSLSFQETRIHDKTQLESIQVPVAETTLILNLTYILQIFDYYHNFN